MQDDLAGALSRLSQLGTILAMKVYRTSPVPQPAVPVLPCLDHEAVLHQHVPPHISTYVSSATGADIHEVAIYPARRQLQVDTVSTLGEFSDTGHAELLSRLRQAFPDWQIEVKGPAWWRGERRVAEACRAQITLREVLLGNDADRLKRQIDRLQMVGSLMEKQSRVASWGVRTVTGPLLAAVGVVLYAVLGLLGPRVGLAVTEIQYAVVGALGTVFLYYGLKAVQLTDMANRVWKRGSEYSLLLSERRRLRSLE